MSPLLSWVPGKVNKKRQSKSKKRGRAGGSVSTGRPVYDVTRSRGLLVPQKIMATLRFQRRAQLTASAAGYASEEYSMNSPYDPLYTVGGGVCTGWADLMLLYSRAFVVSARLSFCPTIMSHGGDVYFVLPVRSDEAAAGVVPTIDMVMEGQNSTFGFAQGTYTRFSYIVDIRRPAQFQGLANQAKDQLSCSVSTDPVIQPAWYCGLIGAQNHTIDAWVLIEYTTEMYRPNSLSDA